MQNKLRIYSNSNWEKCITQHGPSVNNSMCIQFETTNLCFVWILQRYEINWLWFNKHIREKIIQNNVKCVYRQKIFEDENKN